MISMRDLLRDELEEERHEVRELRAYLRQVPIDEAEQRPVSVVE